MDCSKSAAPRVHASLLALWAASFLYGGTVVAGPARLWQPARDDVFLQETGRNIRSSEPLRSVAALGGTVFVSGSNGVWRLDQDRLAEVPGLHAPIDRLVSAGDALWAAGPRGLHRWRNGEWRRVSEEVVADLTAHNGEVIAATGQRLFQIQGDALMPLAGQDCPFGIKRILSHCESLYVMGSGRLTVFDRARFGGSDVYDSYSDQTVDWSEFPSQNARDALSDGGKLWFATDRGLGLLRGMSLTTIRGEQGLPFEDTLCLARGFTNDIWVGTARGAIRMIDGQFHYFAGQRWLPNDRVNAIAVAGRAVYLVTDGGLGVIEYEPYTLLKKAVYYERHLEEWGQKRLGFTHKLEWDDRLKEFVREISDNDGGYSGDYLAAQSYRYAVTKEPAARREALNTFRALRWLEAISGIPGFPARAVWAKGERGHKAMHGSGGYPAEWHDAPAGIFEWKGDTSSDELCSHYYAVTRFLELAAQGDELEQARQHLRRMATHLVDHGWQLIDVDGKPTRWGRWDPEYFRTEEGRFDRGLQALEILSFMKTTASVTGEDKFAKAYETLVALGYPGYTLRQRQVFPLENIAHFEDQLALWSYWNLLVLEKNPPLRALYRRSFERTFEIIRVEQNPWFNFVYGALTGNDCEVGQAVAHLRDWPLDLRTWPYQNSHRADLRTPTGYNTFKGGIRAFPPRETEPMRWDHWTMQMDGGSGGRDVVEPGGWLVAYWMGRYYGFIEAPSITEPELRTVEHSHERDLGAKPYEGPPRPEGF